MAISIFLSYPKPCFGRQKAFVEHINEYLVERGFAPRTLGVTDYDMDAPLTAIRRLMLESNGLLTIAFRRTSSRRARCACGPTSRPSARTPSTASG